jgi:hypothetical protein
VETNGPAIVKDFPVNCACIVSDFGSLALLFFPISVDLMISLGAAAETD